MAEAWLERIGEAVERDGRSRRKISMAAGLGPNFVSEMLQGAKAPHLGTLARLCAELKVTLPWVLTGVEMSPDAEEMLAILARLPADRQALVLDLARSLAEASQPQAKRSS